MNTNKRMTKHDAFFTPPWAEYGRKRHKYVPFRVTRGHNYVPYAPIVHNNEKKRWPNFLKIEMNV